MPEVRVQILKPPYRVPSMDEVRAVPPNGLNAISTFSGCGGSSLGLRMAGFRVLWASEFIETARKCYELNHEAIVDSRDIRAVSGREILDAIGMDRGELDLMEGSPPCSSFSPAGKLNAKWGRVGSYSSGVEQRTDDLFFEYARLLREVQPKVFIAENVAGLVRGVSRGYFLDIKESLESCGYRVEARVLDASLLGVPQRRHRLIFMGIRSDVRLKHAWPKPLRYTYSISDACPWIKRAWSRRNGGASYGRVKGGREVLPDEPMVTITATLGNNFAAVSSDHPETVDPVDSEIVRCSPSIETMWSSLKIGQGHPRHFNLIRTDVTKPSPTILAMHGTKGVYSPVHPFTPRKFTIHEVKRICSFPDDFRLIGTHSQRWERLGRSVPPLMMAAIGRVLRDEVFQCVP